MEEPFTRGGQEVGESNGAPAEPSYSEPRLCQGPQDRPCWDSCYMSEAECSPEDFKVYEGLKRGSQMRAIYITHRSLD